MGFCVALLLAALFKVLPNGLRFASRVVLVLGVGLLLTALYFSVLRGSSGVGPLTSPSAPIQDAKSAVEQTNLRQQQEELRKIHAD